MNPRGRAKSAEISGTSKTDAVQKVATNWKAREAEAWSNGFYEVVEQVIYKYYKFGVDPAPYLTRHGILHGRVFDYASKLNSTRVFLLLDTVAELWHEKQKTLAPATIQ
jgi:hypothetical protein